MTGCQCPIDWSVCFAAHCPRAEAFRKEQAALYVKAMNFLGDPFKSVGLPIAADPDPNIITQLIERGRLET
jgi:hypothetical protein